jgi:hypothetical protein
MIKIVLIIIVSCCCFSENAAAQNTQQSSQGNCSPNVANSKNSTISCYGSNRVQPPFVPRPRACSVNGTFVPLEKVMNTAFAPDYEGCSVQTLAKFEHLINPGDYGATGLDNYVGILAYAPGARVTCCIIAVPKNLADAVFTLKPGDTMNLLGGTRVRPVTATEYSNVVFIVSAISPVR